MGEIENRARLDWEMECRLINELTLGKELANQLRNYHFNPSNDKSKKTQFLVEKILYSFEKTISMIHSCSSSSFVGESKPNMICVLESPNSIGNYDGSSPTSQGSNLEFGKYKSQKVVCKKRKSMPQLSEKVKVCSGKGIEGPLDDGHCWRKYGQKDILNSNFPRGYYRCTHRYTGGCLATKQVQRSNEDPSIIELTYKGSHSCNQTSPNSTTKKQAATSPKLEEKPKPSKEILFNFGAGTKDEIFPSFCFPDYTDSIENNPFPENGFFESFSSPNFISPTTSESNLIPVSPYHMTTTTTRYGFGGLNVRTPESNLSEIVSANNSVTNSPIEDFDLSSFGEYSQFFSEKFE